MTKYDTSPLAGHENEWRIVGINDTREVVEVGDKRKRITGTGIARECDACGATHEVHVTVAKWFGPEVGTTHLVVGTSCARYLHQPSAAVKRRWEAEALAARAAAR